MVCSEASVSREGQSADECATECDRYLNCTGSYPIHWNIHMSINNAPDLKCYSPPGHFFSLSCSFGKQIGQKVGWHPLRSWYPSRKFWIRHWHSFWGNECSIKNLYFWSNFQFYCQFTHLQMLKLVTNWVTKQILFLSVTVRIQHTKCKVCMGIFIRLKSKQPEAQNGAGQVFLWIAKDAPCPVNKWTNMTKNIIFLHATHFGGNQRIMMIK